MLPGEKSVFWLPKITLLIRKVANNTPFVVSGTGKPLRQFIYSYDLAKLFIWQLREYNDVEPVILSGKFILTIASFLNLIRLHSGRRRGSEHQRGCGCHRQGSWIQRGIQCKLWCLQIWMSVPISSWFTQFDTARADGQFRKPASNKKLLTLIGGFQFTPFEEGLCSLYIV